MRFYDNENLSKVHLQNRAVRILTGCHDYVNVRGIDLVKYLKWMNVIQRRDYFTALSMFKCIHGLAPTYISDTITMCNEIAIRTTRSSASPYLVVVPFAHINILQDVFSHTGPAIWNAPPNDSFDDFNDVFAQK